MKPKLLLHVCCGPCSTHCIEELKENYDITLYYFNPNTHPYYEYDKRKVAAETVAKKTNLELIEGHYEPQAWMNEVVGLEDTPEGGPRCKICFEIRLDESAKYAKDNGFDCFTTTLSISPHKDSKIINEIGKELAKSHDLDWVHSDFKKNDGYKKSTEISNKLDLYRQNYCGCFFSMRRDKHTKNMNK